MQGDEGGGEGQAGGQELNSVYNFIVVIKLILQEACHENLHVYDLN